MLLSPAATSPLLPPLPSCPSLARGQEASVIFPGGPSCLVSTTMRRQHWDLLLTTLKSIFGQFLSSFSRGKPTTGSWGRGTVAICVPRAPSTGPQALTHSCDFTFVN